MDKIYVKEKKYCYVISEEDMWDLVKVVKKIDEEIFPFPAEGRSIGTPYWELIQELSVMIIDYSEGKDSYKPNDVIFRRIIEE